MDLNGIAIVGMAGRYADADTPHEFWDNIKNGVNSIKPIADEDLELNSSDKLIADCDPNYVKMSAPVRNADMFDAKFFGIYPREAQAMDPQHRLFLECSWHAIEDAGYDPDKYDGMIGVFGGCFMNTYLLSSMESNPDFMASLANTFHGGGLNMELGNDKDYLATRVSFKLNLRGPSMTMQTACSTSLVAIAQACQNLMCHQCDMALAGAASLKFPLNRGYLYVEGGMVSPDGLCKTFDARANGTVFGNGVGVILMKRLEDAIADGDSIYAVIRGWGLNNDGASKVGYTAPSVDGQAEAVALAQAIAGVDPETISYVEAHGTGTALGDPIEIEALTRAFRMGTEAKQFCAIGALKTNLGHLDCAAGVAGIMKTALMLEHKVLPPSLNFETPNPQIDFENSPFFVNTKLQPWDAPFPRRAGLSSFGVGGTNAHVVLEESPVISTTAASRKPKLVMLSARSSDALETMTANFIDHLKQNPSLDLADVAYTLKVGRKTFNHSRVVVADELQDAVDKLEAMDSQQVFTQHQVRRDAPVIFMFPGQGSQHVNMGRELYETEPVFREHMNKCLEIINGSDFNDPQFNNSHGGDIRSILYPDTEKLSAEELTAFAEQINQTSVAQPAIFAVSYAMAQLWMARGIQPTAMIGHSVGEFVAACLAGVFSLEDALSLVIARGSMMQGLPSGSMIAVRLSEEALAPYLKDGVEIAALNGPKLSVLAGPTEAIERLTAQLETEGVVARSLHTSHAFHSAMMEPVVEPFAQKVADTSMNAPTIPIVSTVTGEWLTKETATDPHYWAKHLRETVRFAGAVAQFFDQPSQVMLEVGPGRTLSTLTQQHTDKPKEQGTFGSMPHAQKEISDVEFYLTTAGRLWQAGVELDWAEFYAHEKRRRLHLPVYPFERKRFWYETAENRTGQAVAGQASSSQALQAVIPSQNGIGNAPNGTLNGTLNDSVNALPAVAANGNGLNGSGLNSSELNSAVTNGSGADGRLTDSAVQAESVTAVNVQYPQHQQQPVQQQSVQQQLVQQQLLLMQQQLLFWQSQALAQAQARQPQVPPATSAA